MKRLMCAIITTAMLLGGCQAAVTTNERTTGVSGTDKTSVTQSNLQKYSKEQISEDIDFLVKTIEEVHPNVYAYRTKEDFYKDITDIKGSITGDMDIIEIYRLVVPAINSLSDGHTNIFKDAVYKAIAQENIKLLPLRLNVRDGSLYIFDSLNKDITISKGAEVTAINNVATKEIIDTLTSKYESGMLQSYKDTKLERDLPYLLYIEYGFNGSYDISYKESDEDKSMTVEGITHKGYISKSPWNRYTAASDYSYRSLSDDTYYLDFNKFNDYDKFSSLLENMFKEISDKKVSNLIVDVRGNGGGNSRLGDLLASYISDKPFTSFNKIDVRYSKQVIDKLYQGQSIECTPGEIIKYEGGIVYNPSLANRFDGKVILLTDRFTFSSATDFTSIIKDYGLGVIIGEETGGLGSCYGDVYNFSLKNTDLRCGVSHKFFVRPNGDLSPRGILPDVEFINNTKDYMNPADDPGIVYALDYLSTDYDSGFKKIQNSGKILKIDPVSISEESIKGVKESLDTMYSSMLSEDYDTAYSFLATFNLSKEYLIDNIIKTYRTQILDEAGSKVTVEIKDMYCFKEGVIYVRFDIKGDKGSIPTIAQFDSSLKIANIRDDR